MRQLNMFDFIEDMVSNEFSIGQIVRIGNGSAKARVLDKSYRAEINGFDYKVKMLTGGDSGIIGWVCSTISLWPANWR